jgi:acetyltransferase-like isoleucine patch superfamily enzyme
MNLPSQLSLAASASVRASKITCGNNVRIGERVAITAEELILGDDVSIEADTEIRADFLRIDAGSRIERRCLIASLRGPASYVHIGENAMLGADSRVLLPVLVMGDFVAIQNHALINGLKPVRIGHNSWVGQNCVLNANDWLSLGNNVGIGAYSSVYTHGFFGDLLEGCQVHKVAPVTLGDDVWILGSYNVISPGVSLGEKALVLTGSNVTRDVPANHCVGGAPARDMTDKLTPFRTLSIDEKLGKMRGFLDEYVRELYPQQFSVEPGGYRVEAGFGAFHLRVQPVYRGDTTLPADAPGLVFCARVESTERRQDVTVFDMIARTYTRTRTRAEVATLAWLKNPRARFVPADRPHVEIPSQFL